MISFKAAYFVTFDLLIFEIVSIFQEYSKKKSYSGKDFTIFVNLKGIIQTFFHMHLL